MTELQSIVLLTAISGACIPLGGAIARIKRIQPRWLQNELRHFLVALGGGLLLGGVAVVLVPEGVSYTGGSIWAMPLVLSGGIIFLLIERALGLRRRESPQFMGMILDYIPEAIALGGLVAMDSPVAVLMAFLIGMQNLPEGFNAFRELYALNHSVGKTLLAMTALVPIGPLAGLTGYFFLLEHHAWVGGIMLFASGGILYLIFQDIAPQAKMRKHWVPPLGAVFGFCLALFSRMLIEEF